MKLNYPFFLNKNKNPYLYSFYIISKIWKWEKNYENGLVSAYINILITIIMPLRNLTSKLKLLIDLILIRKLLIKFIYKQQICEVNKLEREMRGGGVLESTGGH